MLDAVHLLVIGLVGAVSLAAVQLGRATALQRQNRFQPRGRIADAVEGARVCIVGTVAAHAGTVTSPFSNTPCVFYEITIEQRPRDIWEPVYKDRQGVVFDLVDDSGRASVEPDGAIVAVEAVSTEVADEELTRSQRAFCERASEWLPGRMRVVEQHIREGDEIAVIGGATHDLDPAAQPTDVYRGDSPTRLRLASSPRNQLFVTSHVRNYPSRNRS